MTTAIYIYIDPCSISFVSVMSSLALYRASDDFYICGINPLGGCRRGDNSCHDNRIQLLSLTQKVARQFLYLAVCHWL